MCFFINDAAPPVTYTLSLHDALPILISAVGLIDGGVRWRQRVPRAAGHIVVTDHWVYALSTGAMLYELDRKTGQPRSAWGLGDRKSTRLNSSHVEISYAVFCLKKKTK